MKILVIHNHYREAGGEDAVMDAEVKLLRKHGHEVRTYVRTNKEIEAMSSFGKAKLILQDALGNKSVYKEIQQVIDDFKPDIAHVHNIFLMISPSVYHALKAKRVPIVQTIHNYRLLCPKATFFRNGHVCEKCSKGNFFYSVMYQCWRGSGLLTFLLSRILQHHQRRRTFKDMIDHYIVLTKLSYTKYSAGGYDPKKMTIKPNFVDMNLKAFKKNSNQKYAVFVGRLSDGKGVLTLLKGWKRLPEIPLKVVGDGPLFEEMKSFINEEGINNVEMMGRRPNQETKEIIYNASFLIFPSEWYECFPVTIVEALSLGIPVIASHIGGMAEIIESHKTGIFFEPGDEKDLSEKVKWAWMNPSEMETMGVQARKTYEQLYSSELNYWQLLGIYEKTIANYTNKQP